MAEWTDVVAIALRFPEVEESTWFGTPSLKVRGKGIARLRTNPDAMVIRVLDNGDKEALMLGKPDVYFQTPHYEGWPYVLVRLENIERTELEELVEDAWRIKAPRRVIAAFDAAD